MSADIYGIADDRALGVAVRVVVTHPGSLQTAKAAVDEVVRAIDCAASRFREDSELSRLNASPERDVFITPLLAQAMEAGLRAARLTDGAVDPTVGTAMRVVGYDSDFATVLKDGGPLRVQSERVAGWRAIRFDPTRRLVWIPRGVEIDLGATAKALTADLAAAKARRAVASGGVLVSLGGDIAVAGEAPTGGWQIQVSEDSASSLDDSQEAVSITSGGIATSSTTVRRWTRGGIDLHHVIDPSTGWPVDGPWRTATVAAGSCVDANIAATAAIVKGWSAVGWLEKQGMPARLIHRQGQVFRLAGWPRPGGSKPALTIL